MKTEGKVSTLNHYGIDQIKILDQKEAASSYFHLFHKDQDHTTTMYTDATVEHKRTWIDKYPYHFDPDWMPYAPVKRIEFLVSDANFVLCEKKVGHRISQTLYINQECLEEFLKVGKLRNVNQISLTENGCLKIKRLGELTWK